MATPAGAIIGSAIIGGAISGISAIGSYKQGQKAFEAQQMAAGLTKEEKIAAYRFNIERSEEEMGKKIGDIQRGGAEFARGQTAAMGAAGAEVGSGTQLQHMLETETGIARDVLETRRAHELEIEFMHSQLVLLGAEKPPEWLKASHFKKLSSRLTG